MALVSLQVSNFRCIDRADVDLDPRCTVIVGDNGAGKTSLLEAIHVLSCGRSFRTNHNDVLLRAGSPDFFVLGQVVQATRQLALGVRWSPTNREVHIGGRRVSGQSALASALPVQVIDPGAHKLLESGPSQRRRFLDWGVFHVEQSFIESWRVYHRALRQRNAALKSQQPARLVRTWDDQWIESGERVSSLREKYLTGLAPIVAELAEALLGTSVTLTLKRGWDSDRSLGEALNHGWARDLRFRGTSIGPHRADLEIQIDGVMAKERVSRGQQKLLACALTLAQLRHHVEFGLKPACLLLDDPAAELDVDNLEKLLRMVRAIPIQLVASAVDQDTLSMLSSGKTFHVKQGHLAQVL